jgi:hypothetical protein
VCSFIKISGRTTPHTRRRPLSESNSAILISNRMCILTRLSHHLRGLELVSSQQHEGSQEPQIYCEQRQLVFQVVSCIHVRMTTRDKNLTKSLVCFLVSNIPIVVTANTDHFLQAGYLHLVVSFLYNFRRLCCIAIILNSSSTPPTNTPERLSGWVEVASQDTRSDLPRYQNNDSGSTGKRFGVQGRGPPSQGRHRPNRWYLCLQKRARLLSTRRRSYQPRRC